MQVRGKNTKKDNVYYGEKRLGPRGRAFQKVYRLEILQWALRIAFVPVLVFSMYLNIAHRVVFPWNYAVTFLYLVGLFALWLYTSRQRMRAYATPRR